MMYEDANQRAEELQKMMEQTEYPYRMASVVSIVSGRPMLKFYGEMEMSQKRYKYLSGYVANIGDKVLLARTGNTYVILGKVV